MVAIHTEKEGRQAQGEAERGQTRREAWQGRTVRRQGPGSGLPHRYSPNTTPEEKEPG